MKFKKTAISTALILSLCGVTQGSGYKIIVSQEKNDYDIVESQEPTPTDWEDVGSEYNCVARFDPADYNLGTSFTQIEDCDQKQERTVVIKEIFNGEERYRTITEERVIKVEVTYLETGTKNYILEEQADPWSNWLDVNGHYDCNTWNPNESTINLGTSFTQSRDCSQDQTRDRDVYDVWADGAITFNRNEIENQTISETESQAAIGTKNYKTGSQRTEHTPWVDNGGHYSCSTWLPSIATVYKDTSFTQNRNCSQDQDRTETIYDIWADGSETVASTTQQSQTVTEVEAQQAVGTMLAQSCKQILNGLGSTGDGFYDIYIDSASKRVFCDMTTDGGGWTIVAAQNLYVEGYPAANAGIPDNNPNNVQGTRFTRWPKFTEYAVKSVIDLNGAPYDASVAPEFRKFNTGSFGEVEVDMMSFYLNKGDYQNGRASNNYVMYNGVPWGDSHSHDHYYGYRWFNKNDMTYNHWGQSDVWGHLVNSNLFRIASTVQGYARTAHCGSGWAANDCRLALSAWVYRSTIKQKALFMVR